MKNPQSFNASARRNESNASPWSPLRQALFRSIWIATVVSNTGTWMQSVGVAWLAMMSSLTVAATTASPAWVRARALGIYLLVFQGMMAGGSFAWGALAERFGNGTALSLATSDNSVSSNLGGVNSIVP